MLFAVFNKPDVKDGYALEVGSAERKGYVLAVESEDREFKRLSPDRDGAGSGT